MSQSRLFNVANMSFNAIREKRILAKISEYRFFNNMKQNYIMERVFKQIHRKRFTHLKTLIKGNNYVCHKIMHT